MIDGESIIWFSRVLTPLLAAILYRAGGSDKGWMWWRWGMGLWLQPLLWWINPYWSLLCIPLYWVATSAFVYGEKSWLNPLGEYGKFFVCGIALGAAGGPVIGLKWGIIQSIIGGFGFVIIKLLDDEDIVKNPWVERLRGFVGTVLI